MHGIAIFTTTVPLPRLLLVIGGVLPPSSRIKVTVTRMCLPAEIPLQTVRPVTFIVPGTCLEICGASDVNLQPSIMRRSWKSLDIGGSA